MSKATAAHDVWHALKADKRQWRSFLNEAAHETNRVLDSKTKDSEEWQDIRNEMVDAVIAELHRQAAAIRANCKPNRPASKAKRKPRSKK